MDTSPEARAKRLDALLDAYPGGGRALSELTGIDQGQISRWRRGKLKLSWDRAKQLAPHFRISAGELYAGEAFWVPPHEVPTASEDATILDVMTPALEALAAKGVTYVELVQSLAAITIAQAADLEAAGASPAEVDRRRAMAESILTAAAMLGDSPDGQQPITVTAIEATRSLAGKVQASVAAADAVTGAADVTGSQPGDSSKQQPATRPSRSA